jgi:hypothetical protein
MDDIHDIAHLELIDHVRASGTQHGLTAANNVHGSQQALSELLSNKYSHPDIQTFLQSQPSFE